MEYYAVIRGRIDEPTIFSSWYLPSLSGHVSEVKTDNSRQGGCASTGDWMLLCTQGLLNTGRCAGVYGEERR
jgi:hypothetical protein